MAVARQGIIKTLDENDFNTLPEFVHELRTHNMYRAIVEDLLRRPGFIKKEYIMREDKNGQVFISQVVFENQETFDNYMKSEEIASLWEFLKISAENEGMSIEIIDSVI